MKIHLGAAAAVILAGWYFSIRPMEWLLVCACIVFVFCLEIINTAIEKVCDLITNERNEQVRYIKDISAAGVLLACLLALTAGLVIFVPYVHDFFKG